jgi:hypothetical protein
MWYGDGKLDFQTVIVSVTPTLLAVLVMALRPPSYARVLSLGVTAAALTATIYHVGKSFSPVMLQLYYLSPLIACTVVLCLHLLLEHMRVTPVNRN